MIIEKELWRHFSYVRSAEEILYSNPKHIKGIFQYKDKKKYIGIVFNLDKHTQSGTHWISMFCNIPKKEINYWDSYGYKPPKEVTELMNKLKKQAKDMDINILNLIVIGNFHLLLVITRYNYGLMKSLIPFI